MAVKVSTGLRNALLDSASLKDILDGGFLDIYSGTIPATADDALTGATLLCRVSNGGSGLTFDTSAVGGVLSKNPSEVWQGLNTASGVASFFRFVTAADTGAASDTEERIQGTVAVLGADLNISNTSLTVSAPQAIQFFYVALPG